MLCLHYVKSQGWPAASVDVGFCNRDRNAAEAKGHNERVSPFGFVFSKWEFRH